MNDNTIGLAERVSRLRQKPTSFCTSGLDADGTLPFRASTWLATLHQHGTLDKRLNGLGLSKEEFVALISQPLVAEKVSAAAITAPPSNAQRYTDFFPNSPDTLSAFFRAEYPVAAFFDIVEPLLHVQQQQLSAELAERYPATVAALQPEIIACKKGLGEGLFNMINRTLVLDLNVSRELGLLQGTTPEARFIYYLKSLREREKFESLVVEYPALFELLHQYLTNWRHHSFDLICRLEEERPRIEQEFGIVADTVTKIHLGAGDLHHGGKSVCVVYFKSGARVVYKPRSLDTDVRFQNIIRWLNTQQTGFQLKMLRVISHADYGWVEYVEQKPCHTAVEVASFYEKLGALLALLHIINASDFHYENIIAHGADPTLVDLETLLTPNRTTPGSMEAVMEDSVLRIAILPTWRYHAQTRKRVDFSGISIAEDQQSLTMRPAWDAFQTDQMRIEPREMPVGKGKNNPTLQGEKVQVADYVPQLEAGFRTVYDLVERNRELFVGSGGFIDAFATTSIRVLLRNTSAYAGLLYTSFHPDYLGHYLDRDKLFDQLWHQPESRQLPPELIQRELNDLTRLDVPLFTTFPATRDLWLDHTHRFPDFYATSGGDCCKAKIRRLGREDLNLQCWLIRSSIASALPSQINFSTLRYLEDGQLPVTTGLLLEEARRIGDRLSELAIHTTGGAVSWYGFAMQGEVYDVRPVGIDLYSGMPGIILFLAHLGQLTGEARYQMLADQALACFDGFVDDILASVNRPFVMGAFDGVGGWIYFYAQLGALTGRATLTQRAQQLGEIVTQWLDNTIISADIISGWAGLTLAYLSLNYGPDAATALRHATRCGEALLRAAVPMPNGGVGWTAYSKQPLVGFGHGAGGVAYALAKLYQATSDIRFQHTMQEALRYERSQFLPDKGNWADLRDLNVAAGNQANEVVNMTAWCTGATGIGLGRLGMRAIYEDAELTAEVETALATTLAAGLGWNHSLCHGDAGSLDLLLSYHLAHPEAGLDTELTRILGALRRSFQAHGYISGVAQGVENPGLMTGLAGVGYQLLRLAYPKQVPSVLLLESL